MRIAPSLLLAVPILAACAGEETPTLCDEGVCPAGMYCDGDLGICLEEPVAAATVGEVGSHNALVFAPSGDLVVATYDREHRALAVGRGKSRADMMFTLVDGTGGEGAGSAVENDVGRYSSAAVDDGGDLHVVYYDATNGDLRHATLRGQRLVQKETVDTEGDVGQYADMVASDGILHVAYHDATRGALRYARRGPGGWTTVTVPPPDDPAGAEESCAGGSAASGCAPGAGSVGRFASIGLVAGSPVIAHYDAAGGDLLLSTLSVDGWSTSRIDGRDPMTGANTTDVGQWASLVVDGAGNVSIAYHDATNGALRYTFSEQGVQQVLVIDDGLTTDPASGVSHQSIVGQHASLVVSKKGLPSIYYLDATAVIVKVASRSGSGEWVLGGLSEARPGGLWISAALDDERIAVAFEAFGPATGAPAPGELERDLGLWVAP